ncbi:MAG: tRNA glutamyl-Q(34) synthetase GluQRS [Methyloceanibacter sp.]|nr:tRNA glutamyl-Q(34) synthetase GluQRS [Methyloceanibacter sp.]
MVADAKPPHGFVTRFAPSPTGLLHLGHAYSAIEAWNAAEDAGGTCLLRMEDTDTTRVRSEYEAAIYEDLSWLGLSWPKPIMRQSERHEAYTEALDHLAMLGVTYPCRCSRADIRAAITAPQEGDPQMVDQPMVYPGTCRSRSMADAGSGDAIRLNLESALRLLDGETLTWVETGPSHAGQHRLNPDEMRQVHGDVVLARRDIGTAAYHLAVVVDDAAQGVTHVIRGEDLFEATPIHRLLQALLELPVPVWHHHALVRDENGNRLAKRDNARAIRTYRDAGLTPSELTNLCSTLTKQAATLKQGN